MSMVDSVFRGKVCLTALVLAAGLLLIPASIAAADDDSAGTPGLSLEQIDRALLVTHLHGVTPEIANREVGVEGVPRILEHLRDPNYPRRDNLVAFLFFLDGQDVRNELISAFTSREFSVSIPEEDRARMMIPQALGMQASRGDRKALELLLSISDGGKDRELLDQAAAAYRDSAAAQVDLMEDVMRGLAYSGEESARDRLVDIGFGRVKGLPAGRDLSGPALQLLDVMEELKTTPFGTRKKTTTDEPETEGIGEDPQGQSYYIEFGEGDSTGEAVGTLDADTQGSVHENRLTYANHVDVPNKMDNTRLDTVLQDASWRVGRADYTGDISCCSTVVRSGNPAGFGFSGDGYDRIDNSSEGNFVIGHSSGRVKVVRAINWCGSTGAGIIGCAYTPGWGIAVVRLTNLNIESIVWVHEYGHNTGLQHATQSYRIMYGSASGANNGLSQTECNRYHQPSSAAQALNSIVSTCVDNDNDAVHDWVDNCPYDANSNQYDPDGDGAGQACDNCPDLVNPDQANHDGDSDGDACDDDDDNDGVPDGDDCAPINPFAAQAALPAENVGWAEPDTTTLTWQKGQYSLSSNIYRAAVAMGTTPGWSCLDGAVFGSSYNEADVPASGEGFSYVISAENICGETHSGADSEGQLRIPTPCP